MVLFVGGTPKLRDFATRLPAQNGGVAASLAWPTPTSRCVRKWVEFRVAQLPATVKADPSTRSCLRWQSL